MDRPATPTPTSATARDVILEIVRNMKEGLEPLHYSVLPPAVYHVYLHPDDMERLRAIVPRIVEEARRALDAEVEALNGAARDGVDVRLLVPSKYDHPWVHRLTKGYYNRLLRNGVRIWEWRGEMMHAKTAVVDGRWTRVGSTDFNPLGIAINFELDAIIEDPKIGEAAEAMFENDLSRSKEMRLRAHTARAPRRR